MEKSFSTLAELQAEIQFLKVQQFKQEEVLKEKLSNPKVLFNTVTNFFKADSSKRSFVIDLLNQDFITNISRLILPMFLNGVVFKKSGFILKTLITFLSQKVATQVNSHTVSGLVDKVAGFFSKKQVTAKKYTPPTSQRHDYGIPPDSETY